MAIQSQIIGIYLTLFNNSPISCFVVLTNTALNLCQCLSTFLIIPLGSFPRSGDTGLKVKKTRLLIYCQIAFQKRHPSFYSHYKRMCVSLIQKKQKQKKSPEKPIFKIVSIWKTSNRFLLP